MAHSRRGTGLRLNGDRPPRPSLTGARSGAELPQNGSRYLGQGLFRFPDLFLRLCGVLAGQHRFAARAAKDAAMTIPIVFGVAADPVAMGFVASLNRPGAGATATRSRRVHIDQGLSVPVIQHHADNEAGHSHAIIIPSPKTIAELS
jgi:hypothetical protein